MLHPGSDLKNTYQIVDFLSGAWPDAQAKQSSQNLVGHADSFTRGVLIFICHLEFARFRLDTVRRDERSLIGLPVLGPGLGAHRSTRLTGSDCIIVLHYECIIILRSTDKDYASASAIASP